MKTASEIYFVTQRLSWYKWGGLKECRRLRQRVAFEPQNQGEIAATSFNNVQTAPRDAMKPIGIPRDAIRPNGFFVEAIVNSATGSLGIRETKCSSLLHRPFRFSIISIEAPTCVHHLAVCSLDACPVLPAPGHWIGRRLAYSFTQSNQSALLSHAFFNDARFGNGGPFTPTRLDDILAGAQPRRGSGFHL